MDRQQSLDLLNATHRFPCRFTFKVIGSAENDFVERVVAVISEVHATVDEMSVTTRSTPNGKHVAVTLEPRIHSADHVLLAYERLRSVTGVVITM